MNNHAIKTGVIIGVISIVISLLMYLIDATLFATWWLQLLLLVVYIGLVSYFGIQHRNEIGGYISFGKSWVYSFTALAVSGIIGTLFSVLLFNVIDPELPEIITNQAVENAESMMQNFGMPEDQMDEALEKTRNDTMDGFTPFGLIRGYLFMLIGYAIFSLISGAIIKKNEPELEV